MHGIQSALACSRHMSSLKGHQSVPVPISTSSPFGFTQEVCCHTVFVNKVRCAVRVVLCCGERLVQWGR